MSSKVLHLRFAVYGLLFLAFCFCMSGCAPKESVVFRKVKNIHFDAVNATPIMKADLIFYNPNKKGAKLKKVDMNILVNEKLAGTIDQVLNQKIKGESEFIVPIEVKLNLKELGLLDTIINLFGGKKYNVHMIGKIRVSVHGFAVSVPVNEQQELRIR